jgi:hypothetical protein
VTAAVAAAVLLALTGVVRLIAQPAYAAGGLRVQYRTTMTQASAYEIEPWLTVTNTGSDSVPLNQVVLRYYFTADTTGGYVFACAWAVVGCSTVTGHVVAMPTTTGTADHYLEIAFTSGTLAAGASTGDLQLRLYRQDWQNVNQANDYSFRAQGSYADSTAVTAYRSGTLAWGTPPVPDGTGSPSPTGTPTGGPPPPGGALFDDFSYSSSGDPALAGHGWTVRTGAGGPGVSGATWSAGAVTFPTSGTMQLTASTAGSGGNTVQAEVYQQRKFFEGTYAARVRFSDAPASGPDGDAINETFFTISPLRFDNDPQYSENDFEYLPNGGWGVPGPKMYLTTWYTYQNSPWVSDNSSTNVSQSYDGWHTLVAQVGGGHVTYYIDSVQLWDTSGKYYPRTYMSINFNEWFIDGGLVGSSTPRGYVEQVDWLYFKQNEVVPPGDVNFRVAAYRTANTTFTDTVPPWNGG